MDNIITKNTPGVTALSRFDIEQIAEAELKKAYPLNLENPIPLDTKGFITEYIGLYMDSAYIGDYASTILGLTVMSDTVLIPTCDNMYRLTVREMHYGDILISKHLQSPQNTARRRYTEMHEISHWLLHKDYYDHLAQRSPEKHPNFIACRSIERYKNSRKTDADWLEWQADSLAAALLMPRDIFYHYARHSLYKHGANHGYLVQGNPQHKEVFRAAIQDIASRFQVSHRAAQIRMIHLGLIKTIS